MATQSQAKYKKRGLISGLGIGYFAKMTKEETPIAGPEYESGDKVYASPSLDKVNCEIESTSKKIFLSNLLHSNPTSITSVSITVDAGYLPEGFEEWAMGMEDLGDGAYRLITTPETRYFRFAFPVTDENGNQTIINFFKCKLEPVGISSETQREEMNAQIVQYKILALPLTYQGSNGKEKLGIYAKVNLADEKANGVEYDYVKLLEVGFYDQATKDAAKL